MRKVRSLIQTHYFWQESVPIGEELPLFTGCLEKLSEKGLERGFDHRFGQYTNAKTARKVPFRCPEGYVLGASETLCKDCVARHTTQDFLRRGAGVALSVPSWSLPYVCCRKPRSSTIISCAIATMTTSTSKR